METILIIIGSMALVGIFFSSLMLYRNQKVFDERMRIIDLAKKEIGSKDDSRFRYLLKESERYSYDEMLYKIWKPVNSFYQHIN